MQTAKLFMNGNSQAVRLPKEFRFHGDQVYIKRMSSGVLLLPYDTAWQGLFDALDEFSPDICAEGREQPVEQERTDLEDMFDEISS